MANITASMFLQVGKRRYQVASFQQASIMFERARDAALNKGVEPGKIHGEKIVDERGSVIAHVSYNGRVWPGSAWNADATPLYDNRGA